MARCWILIHIVILICGLLGFLFGAHHGVIAILGTLRRVKRNPEATQNHKMAVLIAARNEAAVIGELVHSLRRQKYPRELFDIYVLPNNCTDDTARIAKKAGAKILLIDQPVHSKGEVLRYAFQALSGTGAYDAYVIFDADNIVDPGFLRAANNALCAGYPVAQGYRESKNPNDSWVAGCTSVFFWFMNRLYSQARFALGMCTALNGTGIMISDEVIQKIGWNPCSLTEDLEFTAQCILNDIKIGWMGDAILYDEQPRRLRDSILQRQRWTAGGLQCLYRYFGRLIRHCFRGNPLRVWDMLLIYAGPFIQLISTIPIVYTCASLIHQVRTSPQGMTLAIVSLASMAGAFVLGSALVVLLICVLEKKMCKRRIVEMCTMWFFLLTWTLINLMAPFRKPPKWVSIPHGIPAVKSTAPRNARKNISKDRKSILD